MAKKIALDRFDPNICKIIEENGIFASLGMEISNASLLDEGTAAGEALSMIQRQNNGKKTECFVSDQCHPQTINLIKQRAEWMGVNVLVGNVDKFNFNRENLAGVIVQYPDTRGILKDYSHVADALHATGGKVFASKWF